MSSPTVALTRPERRLRAMSLRRKPSSAMAVRTRSTSACATAGATASLGVTAEAATTHPSPTAGLTRYNDTFSVQHPYDLKESDRFSVANGVYSAWILKGDKPLRKGSHTGPRTEMRWAQNWRSGEHMFA